MMTGSQKEKSNFIQVSENNFLCSLLSFSFFAEKAKAKAAIIESCTGGYLSAALTKLSGSSRWFDCGMITYSNEAKGRFLNVDQEVLQEHGAVSFEVAKAMVNGLKQRDSSHKKIYLSITGICGPTGANKIKPIGLVYFCCGI